MDMCYLFQYILYRIIKILCSTKLEQHFSQHDFQSSSLNNLFILEKQENIHFIHCSQSQHLFLWHWGEGARAPVVQTIIIWVGSKKSHVPQFMSAVVAWRNGWFRLWNKLRNHFLCTAVIHLSPDTQTFRACFLSNWRGRQVSNYFHSGIAERVLPPCL